MLSYLNLTLRTNFVVDKLVVPGEILLLLMNGWRVEVVVMLIIMLISVVVEVVAIVVAVVWWTKGWTSLSTRRRADAIVMTLHVMMIIMMMIVVVLVVLALRSSKRIRWIDIHKIYHNTSSTIGRRRQIHSADPFHNEFITATATRRIEIRRGTGTAQVLIVQHTDGTVLANTVRNLVRIDPDRQLQG